jgi:hypothetical protein
VKGKAAIKKIISILMIGILIMTVLLPAASNIKKDGSRNSRTKVLRALNNATSGGQNQVPSSMNMVEEEEEEEYTAEQEHALEKQLPIIISFSFFSPNLFFKEHFAEVSGPPPWS